MKQFVYETHLHTVETSLCGASPGAEFAHRFKSLGYTGIFVTDHFLNGNTTVPDDLPWDDRFALFCHGYSVTAAAGAQVGLDVFLAWEYSYGWAHFLTYGPGKEWLLANPDMRGIVTSQRLADGRDYLEALRAGDAVIFDQNAESMTDRAE